MKNRAVVKKRRINELKKRTQAKVSNSIDRLKAAVCGLTIFHAFEDDAATQAFFAELEDVEERINTLCRSIA